MPRPHRKNLADLVRVVKKLRSGNGCPWDRVQTHQTLKPYLVEETYEALEAIENMDYHKLCEELGDIFLHVVFHAQLAAEQNKFDIHDVIGSIWSKMIRRHPHVFGKKKFNSVDEVWTNWDRTKRGETKNKSRHQLLKNLPLALPALYRAEKVQRRASRLGFDWDTVGGAWRKVTEEINVVKEIIARKKIDRDGLKEELGDLLFAVVNVARKLEIDGEDALRFSTEKFIRRFHYLEERTEKMGKKIEKMKLSELEKLWQASKRQKNLRS
jgi:tetrapyrrole methylase family protein/MazG family protein